MCAGAGTKETPVRVTDYDPSKQTARSAGFSFWSLVNRLLPDAVIFSGPGWVSGSDAEEQLALDAKREEMILA